MGDKAAVFARVSTGDQSEQNQIPDIERYCGERGYEISARYCLRGKSAFKGAQRGEIAKVVEAIRRGDVTVVVCWALDRWTREGIAPYFALKTEVEAAGGRIEFAREPSLSELEQAVKAFMAHEESKRRSERVREGYAATRDAGGFVGGAAWGYRKEGPKRAKVLAVTDDGRRWIPVIFEMIANGSSLAQVAAHLNEQNAGDRRWAASSIKALVNNSAFQGMPADRDGTVTGECEAIVDCALWQQANDRLASKAGKRRGPAPRSMLTGTLRCPSCGKGMFQKHLSRGLSKAVYWCPQGHGSVNMMRADSALNRLAERAWGGPVWVVTEIRPADYSAEIAKVIYQARHLGMQGLSRQEEQAERERLWAEEDRLRELQENAGQVQYVEEADPDHPSWLLWWQDTPVTDRGAWLRDHGFTVTASRTEITVMVPWSDKPITEAL